MKAMGSAGRQGELFGTAPQVLTGAMPADAPPLLRSQLLAWQERLAAHQGPLFRREARAAAPAQGGLFDAAQPEAAWEADPIALDPLALEAQSLSFWRWPAAPHRGAALYLVLDRPPHLESPLLLYVGETGRADRRWKGDHDCKSYLASYSESLRLAGLTGQLSIRFWCDADLDGRRRRRQEQRLIRHWLPPFNKETRERWATPFTADPA